MGVGRRALLGLMGGWLFLLVLGNLKLFSDLRADLAGEGEEAGLGIEGDGREGGAVLAEGRADVLSAGVCRGCDDVPGDGVGG